MFIFDGRNILDHEALFEKSFNDIAIGKALKLHNNNQLKI